MGKIRNLITSPSIFFFPATQTICDFELLFSVVDDGEVFVPVLFCVFQGEEFDECKASGFSFTRNGKSRTGEGTSLSRLDPRPLNPK